MKVKNLHHTEVEVHGKTQTKYLAPKKDYRVSEMNPQTGKKDKGVRELESRNNKHPYIFRGRRM